MLGIDAITTPLLQRSGLGPVLTDDVAALEQQASRFARTQMRPAGQRLDRLSATKVIAPGSPLFDYLAAVESSGLFDISALMTLDAAAQATLLPVLSEELGWGDVGLALLSLVGAFPAFMAMMTGDPELIQRFGPLRGCWVGAQPDRGSDLLDINGTEHYPAATRQSGNLIAHFDGDDIILNGQSAAWISGAPIAESGVIYAACKGGNGIYDTEGHLNMAAILVPFDEPGVSKGLPLDKFGQRPLPQGEIFFDSVRLPARYAFAVGEPARLSLYGSVTYANMHMAMLFAGVARATFEHVLRYVHERRQGGVPLIKHQHVRARVFALWQKLEAARAMVTRVVEFNFSSGGPHGLSSLNGKTFVTRAAFEIATEATALFGGNGLTREYPIEKLLRDTQTALIQDGENNMLGLIGGGWLNRWYEELQPYG
ncbi:MAG: acyl-CoA dehydrogenase [Alphaproteobacteria bacterium]|nr:acyl-CoA dehydrogenase [Alphaproteobacteria bacterium]